MIKLISTAIHRSKFLVPDSESWREASGYILLGLGIFLGLAIFTFSSQDYALLQLGRPVANVAGPVGAWVAAFGLGGFGVVGLIWPIGLTMWGALIVFGFHFPARLYRFIGLGIVSIILASLAHVLLPSWDLARPTFGYGGAVGELLGGLAQQYLGFGGACVVLAVTCMASLVLTGNLSLVDIRNRFLDRIRVVAGVVTQYVRRWLAEPISDEELIKQALIEQVKLSRSLDSAIVSRTSRSSNSDLSDLESSAPKRRRKKKSVELSDLVDDAMDTVEMERSKGRDQGDSDGADLSFYYRGKAHGKPTGAIFSRSSKPKDRSSEFAKMAKKLTDQLLQFKIEGKVTKIVEGPIVTTFEFEPVPGTKVSKIESLAKDLARLLQANSLRILAPIPGKKVVGFEVPNAEPKMIGFADLVEHRNLKSGKIGLPVAMGLDAFGKVVIEDLTKMPHLLVAGSTGSGKSVFMNALIGGLIARHSAKDLRFVMVDPKMVELAAYNDLPHMACPVITDPAGQAKDTLNAMVGEMEDRFNKMRLVGARNIDGFNEIIKKGKKTSYKNFDGKWQTMPYIVLIIDELADMMMVLGKEAEVPITRLAQKARAAGIHLVIATQRPSAEVVTGLIKANFPTRIAFRVLSALDSRTILDSGGAEALIGRGDMLFLNAGGMRRMHGAFLSDGEVQKMVKAAKVK